MQRKWEALTYIYSVLGPNRVAIKALTAPDPDPTSMQTSGLKKMISHIDYHMIIL